MTLARIPPLVLTAYPASDEDDTLWLVQRVHAFKDGMKAAADATLEIARNWVDGRQVGRFYPDQTVYDFLSLYYGTIRLPREERDRFLVKLVETGISARKAAKLAGVSNSTASSAVRIRTVRTRKPPRARPDPTLAQRLVRDIDGILGERATLPASLSNWLGTDPPNDEREAVTAAFERLAERVNRLGLGVSDEL